jgi:glycyl-tRNA synthetase
MKNIINFLKSKGFVFVSSEIYGGVANVWDYGHLGVLLKQNIKNYWSNFFIKQQEFNYFFESAILTKEIIWEATSHLKNFFDEFIECKKCNQRFKADSDLNFNNNLKFEKCPHNQLTEPKKINLMFKLESKSDQEKNNYYLRPETAQGIIVNFKSIFQSLTSKLPLGIGQIGKSFRNEITLGNFIFRTKEFEQMELEFFFNPNDKIDWMQFWLEQCKKFFLKLGLNFENNNCLSIKKYELNELPHYSKDTIDIEYNFSFGKKELMSLSNRSNYDFKKHSLFSGSNFFIKDNENNEKFIPHIIEPSIGLERLFLALIFYSYKKENIKDKNEKRLILKINPVLSPYFAAIISLAKKLNKETFKLYQEIKKNIYNFNIVSDLSGKIGRAYRKQDEIGTFYCLTFDYQSLNDKTLTVRNRNTMHIYKKRIKFSQINNFLNKEFLKFWKK